MSNTSHECIVIGFPFVFIDIIVVASAFGSEVHGVVRTEVRSRCSKQNQKPNGFRRDVIVTLMT
jgi:hypothetical protein